MIPEKKHFEYFEERCLNWMNVFGLLGWDVYFRFEEASESRASYSLYPDAKQVTFSLYKTDREYIHDENSLFKEINVAAFHEVVHVFIHKLEMIAQWYPSDENLKEAEEHNIIHTLSKLIIIQGE